MLLSKRCGRALVVRGHLWPLIMSHCCSRTWVMLILVKLAPFPLIPDCYGRSETLVYARYNPRHLKHVYSKYCAIPMLIDLVLCLVNP